MKSINRLLTTRSNIQVVQILFLWVIITLNAFFIQTDNEADVLPVARQFFDHHWLPNDWYLNLRIDYRFLFNAIVGFFLSKFSFQTVAVVGHILEYLLFAVIFIFFWKTIKLRYSYGLIALIFFINNQSLIAGEWMLGGLEAKVFAYAFVLLSISSFLNKKYFGAFFYAGLAFSFHPLVGIYSLFCSICALVLSHYPQFEWRSALRKSWPFFFAGGIGFLSIFEQFIQPTKVDSNQAWRIYVLFRLPHHLLPPDWQSHSWIFIIAIIFLLFLFLFFKTNKKETKFLLAYTLSAIFLFVIGLVIYLIGDIALLRFYWFRFADVMIPFITPIILVSLFTHLENIPFNIFKWQRNKSYSLFNRSLDFHRGLSLLIISLVSIISIKVFINNEMEYKKHEEVTADTRLMLTWISNNTPKKAIFLVDPTIENFYILAQRSEFCSFKHTPNYPEEILTWYYRLHLCNGNNDFKKTGFNSEEELQNHFYSLSEEQIRYISVTYDVEYYLGNSTSNLDFFVVFRTANLSLYKINSVVSLP